MTSGMGFFNRGARLEAKLDLLTALVQKGFHHTMSALDDVLKAIDTETNAIAAGLDADAKVIADLRAQLAAAPTVTQATLDTLNGISTRLAASAARTAAIAVDPANPVPTPAPVVAPTPAA